MCPECHLAVQAPGSRRNSFQGKNYGLINLLARAFIAARMENFINSPHNNRRRRHWLLSALIASLLAALLWIISPPNASAQIISVTPDLSFGKVEIGNLKLQLLIVSNTGSSTLTISNITLPDGFLFSLDGLESNSISGTVEPGAWTNFFLFFSPTNVGNYSNTVTINSDAISGTDEFTVAGQGEYPTGRYIGFFYPYLNASATNSGQFTANATSRGAVSGVLQMPGKRYRFSGRFSPSGVFSVELANGLGVSFHVISGAESWDGSVSNVAWTAYLSAIYSGKTPTLANDMKPGSYQMVIGGSPYPELAPTNNGTGTIKISASQAVHISGTLGDGTKFSEGTTFCLGTQAPLYASLYAGRGAVMGWINCILIDTNLLMNSQPPTNSPQVVTPLSISPALDSLSRSSRYLRMSTSAPQPFSGTNSIFGLLYWFKPPGIDPNYPNGFSYDALVSGPVPSP